MLLSVTCTPMSCRRSGSPTSAGVHDLPGTRAGVVRSWPCKPILIPVTGDTPASVLIKYRSFVPPPNPRRRARRVVTRSSPGGKSPEVGGKPGRRGRPAARILSGVTRQDGHDTDTPARARTQGRPQGGPRRDGAGSGVRRVGVDLPRDPDHGRGGPAAHLRRSPLHDRGHPAGRRTRSARWPAPARRHPASAGRGRLPGADAADAGQRPGLRRREHGRPLRGHRAADRGGPAVDRGVPHRGRRPARSLSCSASCSGSPGWRTWCSPGTARRGRSASRPRP